MFLHLWTNYGRLLWLFLVLLVIVFMHNIFRSFFCSSYSCLVRSKLVGFHLTGKIVNPSREWFSNWREVSLSKEMAAVKGRSTMWLMTNSPFNHALSAVDISSVIWWILGWIWGKNYKETVGANAGNCLKYQLSTWSWCQLPYHKQIRSSTFCKHLFNLIEEMF